MTESSEFSRDSNIETKIKKKSRKEFVKEFLKYEISHGRTKTVLKKKFITNDTGFLNNDYRKNR